MLEMAGGWMDGGGWMDLLCFLWHGRVGMDGWMDGWMNGYWVG